MNDPDDFLYSLACNIIRGTGSSRLAHLRPQCHKDSAETKNVILVVRVKQALSLLEVVDGTRGS